jgi:hypothetical protein
MIYCNKIKENMIRGSIRTHASPSTKISCDDFFLEKMKRVLCL